MLFACASPFGSYGVAYARGKFLTLGGTDRHTAGKARKAAKDALAETSLDGVPARAERKSHALTLHAFLETHYEPWAAEHLKIADEELTRLRVNFAEFLTSRLIDLTAFALERWRTGRLKHGCSKATVNRDVSGLKAALNRAVTWGNIKANPITSVKPYRLDKQGIVRYLTAAEELRLLQALAKRDDKRRQQRESGNAWRRERGYAERSLLSTYTDHMTPLVQTALHTGLRRGELLGLRWRGVDLSRALLTVCGAGAKNGETRYVPLNATAVTVLSAWKPSQVSEDCLVFSGDNQQSLEDVKTAWAGIVKGAKLHAFRFHDLVTRLRRSS